jgi:hypothetical protein
MKVATACEACVARGNDRNVACPHKTEDLPSWTSSARREMIKDIYGEAHREQFQRENMGIETSAGPECFTKESIDHVFDDPGYVPLSPFTH